MMLALVLSTTQNKFKPFEGVDNKITDSFFQHKRDVAENIIIVGSCLKNMQPKAFKSLEHISKDIYEVCLESTHINMVITKLIGMLSRVNVKKLIFASVDKSPHCVQLHYIEHEIEKAMDLSDIEIIHYVCKDNKLIQISNKTISLSKSLSDLESMSD